MADLSAARLDLERTSIKAPFNGRVSAKEVDEGQYVAPGTPVAAFYGTDVAQVRLPLTDRQVALVDLPLSYDDTPPDRSGGAEVLLRARFAGQMWEWRGRIVRTDATIDVDSRLVYAVAEVQQPFAREPGSDRPPLSPGLFVDATISGRQMPAVSVLPRSALRSDGSVMVVDAGGKARPRQVQVLKSSSREVWLQGLDNGAQVIVQDGGLAVAGMEVRVRQAGDLAGDGVLSVPGPIRWFIDNPIAANLLMVFLLVGGLFGIPALDKQFFPEFELNLVQVSLSYPGAGPREVEEQICVRIEEAVHDLAGVREIRASARQGLGTVLIEAETGYDMQRLTAEGQDPG